MHGVLRKWLLLILLFVLLTIPFSTGAQGTVALETFNVQLWPEFDQPAMLVIYDFTLAEGTTLPVDISLRIPADATLIAVAYAPPGSNLLNAPYEEPYDDDGRQALTVKVDTEATYHIEYYAPLTLADLERNYVYLWSGAYNVNLFSLTVRVPVDTTGISTDPPMTESTSEGSSQTYLNWSVNNLTVGEQIPITITYTKTSDRLSMSEQPLETGTVDENTQGRVSLSNYLPYILGGLGVLLIFAGGLYFWQTSKGKSEPRKRHLSRSQDGDGEEVYCHQCGKRAQSNDRFCRTCGTRLRKET